MTTESAGPPDAVREIMESVRAYGDDYADLDRHHPESPRWQACADAANVAYAALETAVTRLVAERDVAMRNVDLLAAALVESEGIIQGFLATPQP